MYSNKQDAADAPKSYARPKQDQGKSAKLQITNLHYEVSERELEVRQQAVVGVCRGALTLRSSFAGALRSDRSHRGRPQDQGTSTRLLFLQDRARVAYLHASNRTLTTPSAFFPLCAPSDSV